MNTAKYELKAILHEHGYSVTEQRVLVFNLLVGQEPMTMYELYDRAKNKLDRASTYRIIDLFEKLGIAQRVNIGWKYKIELSDKFAEHHHHLTCVSCHTVIPITGGEMEAFIRSLAKKHTFQTTGHQVEVQGYCARCIKKAG
ncbi:MAG TPA: Fur family transcriptional regulator [Verrucomicrobiae bacterium]|nr:Fur family transcriptional regulator [Verrucomicrobiae bacterium]